MAGWITGGWPIILSTICMLMSVLVTAAHGLLQLHNFHKPYLQSHVLRIIMVAPIYGVGAFLSFVAPSLEFVVLCVSDVWEAIVVYAFLMLIMEYMGGEHLCMTEMSNKEEGTVPQIWPLNLCFGSVHQGHMIRVPKRLALQFVFIKPVMAMLNIIVYYQHGRSYPTTYSVFTNVVYNVSYSLALAGLFLLYSATHDLPTLAGKKMIPKFLSVKSVVFLTYWQALFFPLFLRGTSEEVKKWESFILSVESGVFTWALTFSFWYTEFRIKPKVNTKVARYPEPGACGATTLDLYELPIGNGTEHNANSAEASPTGKADSGDRVTLANAQKATNNGTSPPSSPKVAGDKKESKKEWLKNARAAFNPADVLVDAKQSFSKRYARHVILEDERDSAMFQLESIQEGTVDLERDGLATRE
eukprot:GEMP01024329.1.p1 GENE.GEMP01024329.1~~GEMP01024329.1.p1  ORF type:complete len:415 (+),score=61.92 GEMP01024329.1:60-1304(+)